MLPVPLLSLAFLLTPAPAPDISWLEGHWCGENAGIASEEIWTGSAHGVAVGLHKDLATNGTATFEFMRIELEPGPRATFLAQPGGRPETAFPAARIERRTIVFENAAHDYPKRVGYRRSGDTLEAWIDGGEGTEATRWSWRRCTQSPRD